MQNIRKILADFFCHLAGNVSTMYQVKRKARKHGGSRGMIAGHRKVQKAKWAKYNYAQILVRIKRGSDLHDRIEMHKLNGQSLNSLITMLLCEYFAVENPLKYFIRRKVEILFDGGTHGNCGQGYADRPM
jgi:hypothetical protein